jgi:hypothetical protein
MNFGNRVGLTALLALAICPMEAAAQYNPDRDGQYGYVFAPGTSAKDKNIAAYFSGVIEFDPERCPGVTAAAFFSAAVDDFAERISTIGKAKIETDRLRHVGASSSARTVEQMIQVHRDSYGSGRSTSLMWGFSCDSAAKAELIRSGRGQDHRSTLNLNPMRSSMNSAAPDAPKVPSSSEQAAALKKAERYDALVAAERKRFGPGKDREIRQLVDLRERIANKKPRICRSNAFKEVINFEHLRGVLLVTREGADKIYGDMKRSSATSCPQSSPANLGPLNCSGEGKYLTCTVTKECRSVEYPCPSNRQ